MQRDRELKRERAAGRWPCLLTAHAWYRSQAKREHFENIKDFRMTVKARIWHYLC